MRITFTTVRSGQPRPYADTERVVRLTSESFAQYTTKEWEPWPIDENTARMLCDAAPVGFTYRTKSVGEWWESYLSYFTPIDPKRLTNTGVETDDPTIPVKASTWEFKIVTPYTD
jgi:hypothetical protein